MQNLNFNRKHVARKSPSGIDVETTLAHFAIVTYLIEPEKIRKHVHPRFEPDLIQHGGSNKALLSVVPFLDLDFRFSSFPWLKWRFGQTNYRIYATDTENGENIAWFLGTSLDSWTVSIPHYVWNLPWHKGKIKFDCRYESQCRKYIEYKMETDSQWAPAKLKLLDSGRPPTELAGFDNLESGLVLLTHPLKGYYFRRDGKLGSYSIWHDKLETNVGQARYARFDLLDRLDLVESQDASKIHSVLIQHKTDFTIYLPPSIEKSASTINP